MAELQVDKTEIGLLMTGLNLIGDAQLTEDGKAARDRLARKLSALAGDLYGAAEETGEAGD